MSSNAELIRSAFARWQASRGRDVSIWWEIFADNISFRSAARGREPAGFTRSVDRKSAMLRYFDFICLEMEMLDYQIETVIDAGSRVMVVANARWRMRRTGRILRLRSAKVFWFEAGKVVRLENFYDSAQLLEHAAPYSRMPAIGPRMQHAYAGDHA